MKLQQLIRDIKLGIKYPPKIIEKIVVKASIPEKYRIKYYLFYRKYIFKELNGLLSKVLKMTKEQKITRASKNSGPIWIFWWQGIKQMPLIVERCIQSVKTHANGHRVIVVNKDNIKKYTTIPRYIYIKLYHHDMTLTHFSDILRFNLLYNHGGLWIDSTVFCTSDISDNYFTNVYTSGGYSFDQCGKLLFSKWTEFLIGGSKHNQLFQFMNNYFDLYWKTHKYLMDYLLVDYGIAYAYKHGIDGFKYYVDTKADKNNPHLYDLVECLNEPYDADKFKRITHNTNLFKLTYKAEFNNNNNTFYNRLIHNRL